MKRRSYITYPYIIWSLIFIIVPLGMVLFFSFTNSTSSNEMTFSLDNYKRLLDSGYINVFKISIELAFISTILCLFIGYPVAYIISHMDIKKRDIVILLFILPMWMNFLLRTYAWMSILGKNGLINNILTSIGIPAINMLYTDGAVLLGMVYNFLPFMVLTIYTVLTKIDQDLINAASDLGANRFQVFTKITLRLSVPGIMSGVTMVFMPAVSTFVISNLLGGRQYTLVGNLIEQQFTTIGNWNFGSAVSIIMMILILISMAILSKFEGEDGKEGGGLI
jgi:spermidine/putrescine transport system permease protein